MIVEPEIRNNAKKQRPRFSEAELTKIDAMLSNEPVATKARHRLLVEFNIKVSIKTLYNRRRELDKAKRTLEAAVARQGEKEKAAAPKTVEETLDTFLTLGKSVMSVIGVVLPETNPQRQALISAQSQMDSILRRAKEFRESFDHLSEMRWLLNVMEIRVARMFELEMTMGMPMRDNTTNIQIMMSMIRESIELHQSLGLKPKFGDPKLNININVGGRAGGEGSEIQSERFRRLKALTETFAKATPEERIGMRQQMLAEAKLATDAKFEDVAQ